MDPYRLLSRSTKLSRSKAAKATQSTPSSGQNSNPQLFEETTKDRTTTPSITKKRKRNNDDTPIARENTDIPDFFNASKAEQSTARGKNQVAAISEAEPVQHDGRTSSTSQLSLDERKRIIKAHKLKLTWLNPPKSPKKERRRNKQREKVGKWRNSLYPNVVETFGHLRTSYGISSRLSSNIYDQGYHVPTEVQMGALPVLLGDMVEQEENYDIPLSTLQDGHVDLLTVAPTGSGKTLAFVVPLIHRVRNLHEPDRPRCTTAIILAPTKELAGQIVNEGRKLAHGSGVKISQFRKGMIIGSDIAGLPRTDTDGVDQVVDAEEGQQTSVIKADVLVSTPGILQSSIDENKGSSLSHIQYLVLDEADVLLDPLFRDQTLEIWNALSHPSLRVSLWSATMGSNIEELAKSIISSRLQRLKLRTDVDIQEAPLLRLVVGLKDSAVPNVHHKLVYTATESGKLMGLRQILHPTSTSTDSEPVLRPPFLIFTQTIERAVALHSELLYDIPAEAGGINRIAILHSDLSDTARDSVMTRFRKGEIWILITTDLLSRGVDFRGINGVVNYDIPNSSAAYVHRVGRTGRAGREGGVAVTLYTKEDIPYLKHVANVVSIAQRRQGSDTGVQQWLLDALPKLSKNEKQNLKKRGIESRTASGQRNDPKAARKARISTKAGYVRRVENRRKGAILGSQARQLADVQDDPDGDTDFQGFD